LKAHSAIAMFPRIEVGGGIDSLGMNRAGLIDDLEGTRELQANVTWLRGAHTIKSGLQLARMAFLRVPAGVPVWSVRLRQRLYAGS
jgi:hypothetical protein